MGLLHLLYAALVSIATTATELIVAFLKAMLEQSPWGNSVDIVTESIQLDGRGTGVQTTLFWQGRCLGWSLIITSIAQFSNKIRLIFYVSYMNLYSTYCIYVHMSFVDIELICLTYMRVLKESICIVQSLDAFAHIPAEAMHGA